MTPPEVLASSKVLLTNTIDKFCQAALYDAKFKPREVSGRQELLLGMANRCASAHDDDLDGELTAMGLTLAGDSDLFAKQKKWSAVQCRVMQWIAA